MLTPAVGVEIPTAVNPAPPQSATSETSESQAEQRSQEIEQWRIENKLLSPRDVDALCEDESLNTAGIVAGLIPKSAVTFLIGDSGLGKSPLAYQIGLAVAAGIPPFPGMETEQGPVLYLDYENSVKESWGVRQQLVRFLKLPNTPRHFYVWTPDQGELNLERVCKGKPKVLIVDSMRSHNPYFEKTDYAGVEMKRLNDLARKNGVSILVIHHTRKPGENGAPSLDGKDDKDNSLMLWFKETSGHSAIINHSHTRIAVASPDGRTSEKKAEAALVLRWHWRLRGEFGPLYLERICDEDGEALGYARIADTDLLGNKEQEATLKQLPVEFTFKQAKDAYKRAGDPTRKFLIKCIQLGLVRQTDRGRYAKIEASPEPAGQPMPG
jgi:hypothetical protein